MSRPARTLPEQVDAFVRRHGLVAGVAAPVHLDVALSGGLDSVVLLAVLAELAPAHGWQLRAHHVRHGLRPDDGADAAFAARQAAALGVELIETRLAPGAVAQRAGRGLEERARDARYEALCGAARAAGVELVATGHHGDDNVETLLVRLVRGAGLEGLAGMAPRRALAPGLDLVRPLLGVSRQALMAFARERALDWCEDPTNRARRFLRNRVRLEVAPTLYALRPGAAAAARRCVRLLREDATALEALAEALVARGTRTAEPAWYLELTALAGCSPAAAAQVLRHAARHVVPGHVPSAAAIEAALHALGLWPERFTARAPGRGAPWRDGALELGRDGAFACVRALATAQRSDPDALATLPQPGAVPEAPAQWRWGGLALRTWHAPRRSAELAIAGRSLTVMLPEPLAARAHLVAAGTLTAPLRPAGLGGHRKAVTRALAELGVPARWRPHVPALIDAHEPTTCLWIAGGPSAQAVVDALDALDDDAPVRVLELVARPWYLASPSPRDSNG